MESDALLQLQVLSVEGVRELAIPGLRAHSNSQWLAAQVRFIKKASGDDNGTQDNGSFVCSIDLSTAGVIDSFQSAPEIDELLLYVLSHPTDWRPQQSRWALMEKLQEWRRRVPLFVLGCLCEYLMWTTCQWDTVFHQIIQHRVLIDTMALVRCRPISNYQWFQNWYLTPSYNELRHRIAEDFLRPGASSCLLNLESFVTSAVSDCTPANMNPTLGLVMCMHEYSKTFCVPLHALEYCLRYEWYIQLPEAIQCLDTWNHSRSPTNTDRGCGDILWAFCEIQNCILQCVRGRTGPTACNL